MGSRCGEVVEPEGGLHEGCVVGIAWDVWDGFAEGVPSEVAVVDVGGLHMGLLLLLLVVMLVLVLLL